MATRRPRIFEGPAREAAISRTAAVLDRATASKFEFEALCRHALRRKLVLAGYRWEPADLEAASIVSAALDQIGAVRPTWWQGQREATIPRDGCARCGGPLDDDDQIRRRRFCSEECATAAKTYNEGLYSYVMEDTARAAWEIANPGRRAELAAAQYRRAVDAAPERACAVCRKPFRSIDPDQNTCSPKCGSSCRINPAHDKTCPACGNAFHSSQHDQRACSPACGRELLRRSLPPRPCEECATVFQPGRPEARYCSEAHRDRASARRRRAALRARAPTPT